MEVLVRSMDEGHAAKPMLVLANNPQAGGLARAQMLGVAAQVVDHRGYPKDRAAFEAELNIRLDAAQIDLICLAGFMRVLTPAFATRWAGKMLNIHPSLLPLYPGLHTHERALAAGDVAHGCTVHEVVPELDAGPTLGQARLKITQGETAQELAARVLVLEHKLYPAVVRRFAAGDHAPIFLA